MINKLLIIKSLTRVVDKDGTGSNEVSAAMAE